MYGEVGAVAAKGVDFVGGVGALSAVVACADAGLVTGSQAEEQGGQGEDEFQVFQVCQEF